MLLARRESGGGGNLHGGKSSPVHNKQPYSGVDMPGPQP